MLAKQLQDAIGTTASLQTMQGVSQTINEQIVDERKKRCDVRSWEEFKEANKQNRVLVNKVIACECLGMPGVPIIHWIMFGVITPWAIFLIPLAFIISAFSGNISGWVAVIGCLLGGWLSYKVTMRGSCNGIIDGAKKSEVLYQRLLNKGAFYFMPSDEAVGK